MTSQPVLNENNGNKIERIEANVKWFNPEKGYGFLILDDGTTEIFMHFSVLDTAGYLHVKGGERIICEIGPKGASGLQVLRILEVKFTPQSQQFPPHSSSQKQNSFDPESLVEMEGAVKWFNSVKGYGFLIPDGGGKDVFLRASVLQAAGCKPLQPGVRVLMKVSRSENGPEARTVTVIREVKKEAVPN